MASRQHYLAIAGVRDVAHFLAAFENLNSCILSLSITLTHTNGRPDLHLKMEAFTQHRVPAERVLLASSELSLWRENFQTLDAAIMFSLYRLDAALAQFEMNGGHKKA